MAWQFSVLVVANVTADSPELLEALTERAARESCRFTLLVPAPAGGSTGREAAEVRLTDALEKMRAAGLEVEGMTGDQDAIAAVHDAWDPKVYDDVVVCTLPTGTSKWLQIDLPHRISKVTDAPVHHVVAQPPPPEPTVRHGVEREHLGVLTPLSALSGRRPNR